MSKLGFYKHHEGLIVEVLHISRYGKDCSKQRVIYRTMQSTDLPVGTIFDLKYKEFFGKAKTTKEIIDNDEFLGYTTKIIPVKINRFNRLNWELQILYKIKSIFICE